jgi:Xaa-Pro aminopeptidase
VNRIERLRAALEEAHLDGLLVSSPVDDVFHRHSQNREWLSGFTGSTGRVAVTRERAVIGVDFRYVEQAERECVPRGFEVLRIRGREADWLPELVVAAELGGKNVGLSGADFSYGAADALINAVQELPPLTRPSLQAARGVIEGLRKQKDTEEMANLQRAIDIGDQACEAAILALRPGITEIEVAELIERDVKAHGAEGVSFETIVAAGPWGAMPHASPRHEPVREGDVVVIDMGALYGGYCSDLTRTVVAGAPDAKFREIYDIVFEAQRTAIEGVEPGMTGVTAHRLAAAVMRGQGTESTSDTGSSHGVGLQIP